MIGIKKLVDQEIFSTIFCLFVFACSFIIIFSIYLLLFSIVTYLMQTLSSIITIFVYFTVIFIFIFVYIVVTLSFLNFIIFMGLFGFNIQIVVLIRLFLFKYFVPKFLFIQNASIDPNKWAVAELFILIFNFRYFYQIIEADNLPSHLQQQQSYKYINFYPSH